MLRWLIPALDAVRRDCGAGVGDGRIQISVSHHASSVEEVREILALGADAIGIALDAACADVHARTKPGSWEGTVSLLEEAAGLFPGRISTHLIVGLGETEEDLVRVMRRLTDSGVTIGLFAFTPVRGTAMEDVPQPPIGTYRRVQLARHIIVNRLWDVEGFRFSDGRITGFGAEREKLLEIARTGKPFETSGCPGCNRPYYNECPGGTMYNYPRSLTCAEIEKALCEVGLAEGSR
jgi:biotin synthase